MNKKYTWKNYHISTQNQTLDFADMQIWLLTVIMEADGGLEEEEEEGMSPPPSLS
jgi:hypothetical protein